MSRDLMYQDDIRHMVQDAYSAIQRGGGPAVVQRWYRDEDLAGMPAEAIEWALGVGDPVAVAGLRPGERVLDVGCGGGLDTVLAARAVGTAGQVIGLDLLEGMCQRAERVVREAGVGGRCELVVGAMEDIPLPDGMVDVVVSNGVLNLSARKTRALAEIARVLRPGGRLVLTDLTVDDELPPEVLTSDAAWAG